MGKNRNNKKTLFFALFAACLMVSLFFSSAKETKAASGYVLKINRKQNVVTAYKNNVPVRVMLCSTGRNNATPKGTFYTQSKMRWHELDGPVWGQYCTRITGHYLFHSVYYRSYNNNRNLAINQYRKLGTQASHGCVRVTVEDAKWIYDNCSLGTKVVIYDSNDAGPLGKPENIKVKTKASGKWDPTDKDRNNPHYKYRPTIKISSSKATKVTVGTKYYLKSGVTAKDYKNKDITSRIKVNGKVDTSKPGTYYLKYWVQDSRNYYTYKEFSVKVVKASRPVLMGLKDSTFKLTDKTTKATLKYMSGVSACDRDGKSLTSKIKMTYTKNSSIQYNTKTKTLTFKKPGTYNIKYSVTGTKSNGKKTSTKTIKVYVKDYATPELKDETAGKQTVETGSEYGRTEILKGISAKTRYGAVDLSRVTYTITTKAGQSVDAIDMNVAGEYIITYNVKTATGVKGKAIKRAVTVVQKDPSEGTTEAPTTGTTETTETTTEAPEPTTAAAAPESTTTAAEVATTVQ